MRLISYPGQTERTARAQHFEPPQGTGTEGPTGAREDAIREIGTERRDGPGREGMRIAEAAGIRHHGRRNSSLLEELGWGLSQLPAGYERRKSLKSKTRRHAALSALKIA